MTTMISKRARPTSQVSFHLPLSHCQSTDQVDGDDGDGGGGDNVQDNGNGATNDDRTGDPAPLDRRSRNRRTNSYRRSLFTDSAKNKNNGNSNSNSNSNVPSMPPEGGKYNYTLHRRKQSFRGKERKGDRGQAGGVRARCMAYLEERRHHFSHCIDAALDLSLHNYHAAGTQNATGTGTARRRSSDESLDNSNSYLNNKNNNNQNSSSSSRNNKNNHCVDQYYIPPPEDTTNTSLLQALTKLYSGAFSDLTMWLYAASLLQVLFFFLVLYFIFIYFFVVVLYLADNYIISYSMQGATPGVCIHEGSVGDGDGSGTLSTRAQLEFAFELSWTTFTTVGYGSIAPPGDEVGCYPVRLICSIEAILGVGFVSCCSGIFYAKLMRLLAVAPVTFSSTLCVQYGKGLEDSGKRYGPVSKASFGEDCWTEDMDKEEDEEDDDSWRENSSGSNNNDSSGSSNNYHGMPTTNKNSSASSSMPKNIKHRPRRPMFGHGIERFHPFPVIEFRIVNNRANYAPGRNELWDARVTAIVQLSVEDDPIDDDDSEADSDNPTNFKQFADLDASNKSMRWFASAPPRNNDKKNRKVYFTLAFKPSFHPYFNRIWFLRHTLDTSSPLLRREVRAAIKERGKDAGWDPRLNNYHDIRACLVEFNSLRIIMNGASAVSKSEVYAEKIYTYDDILLGWQFVGICYEVDDEGDIDDGKDSKSIGWKKLRHCMRRNQQVNCGEDKTRVDLSLIHDVVPQRGGDFEPVETEEDVHHNDG